MVYEELITTDPHRRAAVVYGDSNVGNASLRCTVENPDSARVIDRAIVWRGIGLVHPASAYVNADDSLQVSWNQGSCAYAKRMDMSHDFDTTLTSDSALITPHVNGQSWDVGAFAQPPDDSLLACPMHGPGNSVQGYVQVLRRADYSLVSRVPLGEDFGDAFTAAFDADRSLSVWLYANEGLRFKRFSTPNLALVEDTLLIPQGPDEWLNTKAYAVSPQGTRHLVYHRRYQGGTWLIYRYWRADLKTEPPTPPVPRDVQLAISPNPFNSAARISFILPKAENVHLSIFDLTGRLVSTLAGQHLDAGRHELRFDGSGLSSGIYLARLQTGTLTETRKMILLK